ncbi:MAG: ribonuclease P protein component, partial [Thiomicrorhabdus sp.]|nr:ribonuclease P protein component [Thiomicrorhabdus sp.]
MNSNNELSTHSEPSTPSFILNKPINGFSKPLRILKPSDFQHVFSNAEKFGNRNWTLIVRPNQQSYPRLGLAVAKKQLQRA